jgi:hypothetical protein
MTNTIDTDRVGHQTLDNLNSNTNFHMLLEVGHVNMEHTIICWLALVLNIMVLNFYNLKYSILDLGNCYLYLLYKSIGAVVAIIVW